MDDTSFYLVVGLTSWKLSLKSIFMTLCDIATSAGQKKAARSRAAEKQ
jgi:hypothetical protein